MKKGLPTTQEEDNQKRTQAAMIAAGMDPTKGMPWDANKWKKGEGDHKGPAIPFKH